MTTPKAILIGAAMLAAAIVFYSLCNRYQIASGGGPVGGHAWKMDKLSGDVWVCASGQCTHWSN
jgi:hypothetical protein